MPNINECGTERYLKKDRETFRHGLVSLFLSSTQRKLDNNERHSKYQK